MYIVEGLIELGLEEGQTFPSTTHRVVAGTLALGNSRVNCCDSMKRIVQAVIRVPQDRIKTVTINELWEEFGLPRDINQTYVAHLE